MNPQFQTQDVQQQQQQLQGLPVDILKAQQYQQQQQQLQLIQQQRLLQRQQRQIYNQQQQQQQILVGQNSQIPIQLQYQLQQQYQQQQQLQRIQLIQKQKQAQLQSQQGIIVSQSLDQTSFSNQLLLQQNQLLQQPSPLLQPTQSQLTSQQLSQSLLLDAQKKNMVTSQQILQNGTLGLNSLVNQSPTLTTKQSLLQQQLAQQQKLNLIQQSPIQSQGSLKTTTPQLQAQTKITNSAVITTTTTTTATSATGTAAAVVVPVTTKANSITTPSSQTKSILNTTLKTTAQVQVPVNDLQSQINKQNSLVANIPTSSINIDSFTNSSILNVPTSVASLVASSTPLSTPLSAPLAASVSSLAISTAAGTTTIDSIAKSLPLPTTAILTTTTQAPVTVTAKSATSMSPINKSKTSINLQQFTQAQLQSQMTRQMKTSQKSPPLKPQQVKIPSSSTLPSVNPLQSLNQAKKVVKPQASPTITQPSPVNIATDKLTLANRLHSSIFSANSTNITTPSSVAASTPTTLLADTEKINKIPSSVINSITIPTPASQSLSNTALQNYQSLLQLQTTTQQQSQKSPSQPQIKIPQSGLTIDTELDQLSPNGLLLSGLTNSATATATAPVTAAAKATPTATANASALEAGSATTATATTTTNKLTKKPTPTTTNNGLPLNTTNLKSIDNITTPTSSNLTNNDPLLNPKKEPITHININYTADELNTAGTTINTNNNNNDNNNNKNNTNDNKSGITGNLYDPFYSKGSNHSPLTSSLLNNSLGNPIFGKQLSSLSEKIISKGSFLLKCQQFFSVLRSETKNRDILFWKQFVNNYFSDKARILLDLQQIKFIELKRSIIPQYFDVLAKSEINSVHISFGIVDEKYLGDGSCILEGKETILIYEYSGIQIDWIGVIKILFDKEGKIDVFEFSAESIKKYYESSNSYIKNSYPIVNEYGMPITLKRFFEIYEVVNKMDDLINYSISWKIGPKQALSQYASKYKQELKNTPLTLNQQLKLNSLSMTSPLLSLSNSDIMPPPQQISSTSNSAHSSILNSNSEALNNNLNKKRLSVGGVSTTPTAENPTTNLNSITIGNNTLTSINTNLPGNVSINIPTSSSVLSNLATSNAVLSAVVSSATNNLMSAVSMNNLSKANINPTSAMKSPMTNLISPLQMDIGAEPKSKKLKTAPSPRQRKGKPVNTRNIITKNRRNSSNNSSTISS